MKVRHLMPLVLALGAAACSHPREPDDAQLAALLRSEHAAANAADAPLDSSAVACLRAWSGDTTLSSGVPPAIASDSGRKACRARLDAWLADATRNPATFTFAEVDAPPVVKRAVALERQRSLAALARPHVPPAALTRPVSPLPPAAPAATVDLGAAGAELAEAEDLCRQAQQKAADPASNARVKSFARFCGNSLRQARTNLESAARNGADPKRMATLAAGARNIATVARNVLALPSG